MKKCSKCKNLKSYSSFSKRKTNKDGYSSYCKQCASEYNNNYYKTKDGLLTNIYNHQKTKSKKRGHIQPQYTKEELRNWLFSDNTFNLLYGNWVASRYSKKLTPSLDRLDNNKPYSFNNIQIVTWEINNNNANKDMRNGVIKNSKPHKKVLQYSKEGTLINEFLSVREVERTLKINSGNICKACKGRYKSAGGFVWKYKTA